MTLPIRITQAELQEMSELEREVAWKKQHLEEMRGTLIVLLRAGAPIEGGRFDAKLITCIGRAVPWKQVFTDRLGPDIADAVKREYKTHVYYDVRVMEHAVPPLWRDSAGSDETQQ